MSYEINKEALIALRDAKEFADIKESCYVDSPYLVSGFPLPVVMSRNKLEPT
jgi:hypothetical protein